MDRFRSVIMLLDFDDSFVRSPGSSLSFPDVIFHRKRADSSYFVATDSGG